MTGPVLGGKSIISSSVGISTVETVDEHGFAVGNKIKLHHITGVGHTIFSEQSFIVQKIVSSKKFEIKNPYGDTPDVEVNIAFALEAWFGGNW